MLLFVYIYLETDNLFTDYSYWFLIIIINILTKWSKETREIIHSYLYMQV